MCYEFIIPWLPRHGHQWLSRTLADCLVEHNYELRFHQDPKLRFFPFFLAILSLKVLPFCSGRKTYFDLMNFSDGPFKHFLAYTKPL